MQTLAEAMLREGRRGMPDQERIRLMTRLAILEKENGRELRRIEESYRSDYIGIPMLKNGLRITAVFLAVLGIWIACHAGFVLNVAAEGQLRLLMTGALAAYGTVLLVTLIFTFLCVSAAYYRELRLEEEYQTLLLLLEEEGQEKGEASLR